VGEGAVTGALVGAGVGGLVGLGILAGAIPAIGPALAGGTLAVVLANAAGGAAIAGVLGALVGLDVPEADARYYEGEFKVGKAVVTVKADERYDEAHAILHRCGASDGHTAGRAAAYPAAAAAAGQKGRLHEEEPHPRKQAAETGDVRPCKEVHTEQRTVDVPVQREDVVIERQPAAGPVPATEDSRGGEEVRVGRAGDVDATDTHRPRT